MAYAPCFKFYLIPSTVETTAEVDTVIAVNNLDIPLSSGIKSIMAIDTKKQF